MIIDFGYVCMELRTQMHGDLASGGIQDTAQTKLQISGHAGIQSISAARTGARVSLISAIGDDLLSQAISDTLRREGVITSAMAHSDKSTAITQIIKSSDKKTTTLNTGGAHQDLDARQLASTILAPRHLILLHDDTPIEHNMDILKRAKEQNTKCAMSFYNAPNQALFEHLDFALIHEAHLPMQSDLCHIITVPCDGFDCFCGSFVACLQAGYSVDKSIEYASFAQKLYQKSENYGYAALPYLGDIEEAIQDHHKTL